MCKEESDKKKVPPYFSVGSYPVGVKTLAGLFAVFLGALEWIRLYILDVPVHAAMNGFNTAAALVANIGFGAVAVGTVLVVVFASLVVWLIINIVYFLLNFVLAAASNVVRQFVLINPHILFAAWVFQFKISASEPNKLQRWAASVWDDLKSDQRHAKQRLFESVRSSKTRLRKNVKSALDGRTKIATLFWHVDRSDQPERDARFRFHVAVWLVLFAAMVSAKGYQIHRNEMEHASSTYLTDMQHHTADRFGATDIEQPPTLNYPPKAEFFPSRASTLVAGIPRVLRKITIPKTKVGTLLVSKSENAATHLVPGQGSDSDTFRTEPVFYIGDFGEWAYVAPILDFDAGMLVRRSSILEFSFDGEGTPIRKMDTPKVDAEPEAIAVVDVGGIAFHRGGFSGSDIQGLQERVEAAVQEEMASKLEEQNQKWATDFAGLKEEVSQQGAVAAGRWQQSGLFDLEYGKFASGLAVQFADTNARMATMDELVARLDEVEKDLNALNLYAGPSGELSEEVRDQGADAQTAQHERDGLQGRLDLLETEFVGFDGNLSRFETELKTYRSERNALHQEIVQAAQAVEKLSGDVGKLQDVTTGVQFDVKSNADGLADVETGLIRLHQDTATEMSKLGEKIATVRDESIRGRAELRVEAGRLDASLEALRNRHLHDDQRLRAEIAELNLTLADARAKIAVLNKALAEHASHGTIPSDGFAKLPSDMSSLIEDGVATRPSGLLSDLIRQGHLAAVKECRNPKQGGAARGPIYIDFGEGQVRRGNKEGLSELIALLQEQQNEGALVILQGGASYTGQPASNLRLSEARAEWVKRFVLREMLGQPRAHPTDLDQRARAELNLHLLAYGVGESLPGHGTISARAVKAFVCPLPAALKPKQEIAQN